MYENRIRDQEAFNKAFEFKIFNQDYIYKIQVALLPFFIEKDTHNVDEYQKAFPLILRILRRNIWHKTALHHVKLLQYNASYFICSFIKIFLCLSGARGGNKCRNIVKQSSHYHNNLNDECVKEVSKYLGKGSRVCKKQSLKRAASI